MEKERIHTSQNSAGSSVRHSTSMNPQLHVLEQRVQDWYNIFYTLRISKLAIGHYYESASRDLSNNGSPLSMLTTFCTSRGVPSIPKQHRNGDMAFTRRDVYLSLAIREKNTKHPRTSGVITKNHRTEHDGVVSNVSIFQNASETFGCVWATLAMSS